MSTLVATFSASGEASAAARELIDGLRAQLAGRQPALLMYFASTKQPLAELAPSLSAAFPSACVLGASTAGELTERGDTKGAVAAVAIAGDLVIRAGMGTGLAASPEAAAEDALDGLPRALEGYAHRTGLLLLDPLAGNGEEATLITASLLGEDIRLAGGAAGDDLAMATTSIALGDRVASDALIVGVIFSKQPLGVGVCHGHEPISEPLAITRAEGATVHEVEGRPAWDVWAEKTRDAARTIGIEPDAVRDDELIGFLLRYEAGLASGSEYKIRAPLSRGPDGSLSFACAIPEGAKIRITESVPERQIASARTAARRARAQLEGKAAGRDRLRLHLPQPHPRRPLLERDPRHGRRARRRAARGLRDVRRDRARRGRSLGLPQHHHRRPRVPRVSARTIPVSQLHALLAGAIGDDKARAVIDAAVIEKGLRPGGPLSVDEALGVLDHVAQTPGIVGITARFAKSRLHLSR